MSVQQLSSTTLNGAIAAGDNVITLTSITGISKGNIIVVRNEAMKVQVTPANGQAQVLRGYNGTLARAHPTLAVAYFGTPDQYKAIRDSQNAITGDSGVFPDYVLPGQLARDGAGNEFILVDVTTQTFSGSTVQISMDGLFTAAPVAGGGQGPVGLLVEEATSNQFAWAQIYGFNSYAQESAGTSAATSADIAVAATSVSTPNVGLVAFTPTSTTADRFRIYGMFITGAATTATTSAASATGVAVPVFLNYPYTTSLRETITTS